MASQRRRPAPLAVPTSPRFAAPPPSAKETLSAKTVPPAGTLAVNQDNGAKMGAPRDDPNTSDSRGRTMVRFSDWLLRVYSHAFTFSFSFAGPKRMRSSCYRFLSSRPTPLPMQVFKAAAKGNTEIVEWLVAQGADINIPNLAGTGPLHVASYHGHLETVEWLCQHGADVAAVR